MQAVAAVEPELRELLCVLLDADLRFDLSSTKYPHFVGGAVAAILQELLLHLPYEQAALEAPALAHRLALSNSVCARGACCALVAQTYSVPPLPRQLQFRGILSRLLHDRTPGVRGEAVKALALVAAVADASAVRWLLLLGERASLDIDLSVRRASVDSLLQIGHRLVGVLGETTPRQPRQQQQQGDHDQQQQEDQEPADKQQHDAGGVSTSSASSARRGREGHALRCKVMPILVRLAGDNDWQVRVEIACRLDSLCVALGEQWSVVTAEILPALIADTDPDVRCEAIRCLPRLARILLGFAMSGYAEQQQQRQQSPSTAPDPARSALGDDPAVSSAAAATAARGQEEEAVPGEEAFLVPSPVPPAAEAGGDSSETHHGYTDANDADSSSHDETGAPEQQPARDDAGTEGPRSSSAVTSESGQSGGGGAGSATAGAATGADDSGDVGDTGGNGGEVGGAGADALPGGGMAAAAEDGGSGYQGGVRGRLTLAGRKARKGILGALMPAAACLIDDPAAEVRGTAAVTLGEMLRLMVGFEDYVATLASTARSSSSGVRAGGGDPTSGSGGAAVGEDAAGGVGGAAAAATGGGGMETCCCVSGGGDSDGGDGAVDVGFGPRPRRRVCHGRAMRAAVAAAAAAADAVAEAAMTAELIDLAGFETAGDGSDRTAGLDDADSKGAAGAAVQVMAPTTSGGEQQGEGEVVGGLPFAKHDDVDAGGRELVALCEPAALLEDGGGDRSEEGVETPAEEDSSEKRSEERSSRDDDLPPPRSLSAAGDAPLSVSLEDDSTPPPDYDDVLRGRDGAGGGSTGAERLVDASGATAGEERRQQQEGGSVGAAAAAAATPDERLDLSLRDDHDEEDCGGGGSLGSDDAVNGCDDLGEPLLPSNATGAAAVVGGGGGGGGASASAAAEDDGDDDDSAGPNNNNDPLIVLVTRLLLDADANVACTMLQALRPGWVAGGEATGGVGTGDAGDGQGHEGLAVGGGDCADRGGEFREGGGGGGGGGGSTAGGGGGGGTPVLRRSCLLTPAQVGCVLPALAELYGSPLWRVRAAVAEALPSLVSSTLCNLLRDEV
ncbi:unnamed protein product, partial [Ectocarpus sp. 8 AP-2014]